MGALRGASHMVEEGQCGGGRIVGRRPKQVMLPCRPWNLALPLLDFSPQPVSAGCKIFESRPKLDAWRKRVEAAVGENLFQEAHAVVLKAKDMPPLMDPDLKEKLKLSVQSLLY